MKSLIIACTAMLAMFFAFGASAQGVSYQQGYYRSNGTYVQGHYKTTSNNTNHDNYSTRGNTNAFTGSKGYRAKDYSTESYNYGKGKVINNGPRGGQFYNNNYPERTRKTYVPKRW